MTDYDARFRHNFTCLVTGPSGSGKSTFVKQLLLRQGELTDVIFDYVLILLGTEAKVNDVLASLRQALPPGRVEIIEIMDKYPSKEEMKKTFPGDLKKYIKFQHEKGRKGCLVFDDLMSELSECGLLVDLFTKYSAHYSISTIHITQNLFSKGRSGENVTIYRNTHILVLFHNPMDSTVVTTVSRRLSPSRFAELSAMLTHILREHRYVVICANPNRPEELRYMTEIFNTKPIPHQIVYALAGEN